MPKDSHSQSEESDSPIFARKKNSHSDSEPEVESSEQSEGSEDEDCGDRGPVDPQYSKNPRRRNKLRDQLEKRCFGEACEKLLLALNQVLKHKKFNHILRRYSAHKKYEETLTELTIAEEVESVCMRKDELNEAGGGTLLRVGVSPCKRQQKSKAKLLKYTFQLDDNSQQEDVEYCLSSGKYSAQIGLDVCHDEFYYCIVSSNLEQFFLQTEAELEPCAPYQLRLLSPAISFIRRYNAVIQLVLCPLARHVLSPQPVKRVSEPISGRPQTLRHQLNSYQEKAVIEVLNLRKGILLIQGPPGTGKTTTIAELLEHLVQRRELVLVCSASNQAVDNIASKFLAGKTPREKQNAIRIGEMNLTRPQLIPINFHQLLEDQVFREEGFSTLTPQSEEECLSLLAAFNPREGRSPAQRISSSFLEFMIDKLESRLLYDSQNRELQAQLSKLKQLRLENKRIVNTVMHRSHMEDKAIVKILRRRQVIFATCSGTGSHVVQNCFNPDGTIYKLLESRISTVIVDEASQLVEPDVLIPLQTCATKLVLVGDQKQLEPTVKCRAAEAKGFARGLFQRFIECDIEPLLLRVQFRMHPQISYFPNQRFYQDKLINGKLEAKFGFFPFRSVLVDVDGREEKRNKSILNQAEADVVQRILKKLLAFGAEVGVITPYKEQAKLLCERVYKDPALIEKVKINTVDAFQGNEREVIVFSCVRANKTREVGFLSNERRLNVAITRAKHQLIIVGNCETISSHQLWVQLVKYHRSADSFFSEEQLNYRTDRQSFL